jgi:formylglycine-generating enzyme required for sulfatase activity
MDIAPFRPVVGAEPIAGYRLEAFLGRGGFGQVWRASAPGGFQVAVKFLAVGEQGAARELEALRLLQHVRDTHLLSIHGAWQVPGHYLLVMELADGTLTDLLQRCRGQGLPGVPRDELLHYFGQAAEGLDFLNEPRHPLGPDGALVSIQHGDVKPGNLLLVGSGVKVGDFGLVRALQHSISSQKSGGLTIAYAAPEMFRGRVSRQSDQYALAVTWCELRTNRLPFEGGPAEMMAGHSLRAPDLSMLPEEERPAVGRALAKRPDERWPSCRAFVAALRAAAAGPPPGPALPPTTSGRPTTPALATVPESGAPAPTPPKPARPGASPAPAWLLGGLLLTAAVVLGALWALGPRPAGPRGGDVPPDDPGPRSVAKAGDDAHPRAKPRGGSKPRTALKPRVPPKPDPLRDGQPFVNRAGLKMIPIPPGAFAMGSPPGEKGHGEDEDRRQVEVARPYHLADRPVTVGQFRRFVDETKYQTEAEKADGARTWKNPGWTQTDGHPVVRVSWNDAVAYCEWLSRKEGATYRLPTEAEWEYACRAGAATAYFFGDDEGKLGDYAWYIGNSGSEAHRVGTKRPNRWDLYDMHGDVWQWCADWYGRKYDSSDTKDPQGPAQGALRVLRGGSWSRAARECRSAYRLSGGPTFRDDDVGFRVAVSPPAAP